MMDENEGPFGRMRKIIFILVPRVNRQCLAGRQCDAAAPSA